METPLSPSSPSSEEADRKTGRGLPPRHPWRAWGRYLAIGLATATVPAITVLLWGELDQSVVLLALAALFLATLAVLGLLFLLNRRGLAVAAWSGVTVALFWLWVLNSLPIAAAELSDSAWYGASVSIDNADEESIGSYTGREGSSEGLVRWSISDQQETLEFRQGLKLAAGESLQVWVPARAAVLSQEVSLWDGNDWRDLDLSELANSRIDDPSDPVWTIWEFRPPKSWTKRREIDYVVEFSFDNTAMNRPLAKAVRSLDLQTGLPMRMQVTTAAPITIMAGSGGVPVSSQVALFPRARGQRLITISSTENLFGFFADASGGILATAAGFTLGLLGARPSGRRASRP